MDKNEMTDREQRLEELLREALYELDYNGDIGHLRAITILSDALVGFAPPPQITAISGAELVNIQRPTAVSAPEEAPSEVVAVPADVFQAALNYIRHCGANQVMRGQPHPQQQIVDGLELAAASQPLYAAPQETLADENPNTSSKHARERLNVPAVSAPSSSLRDAAKKVVESQRNDVRTMDEKLRDGVDFVAGPGGDEGTRGMG